MTLEKVFPTLSFPVPVYNFTPFPLQVMLMLQDVSPLKDSLFLHLTHTHVLSHHGFMHDVASQGGAPAMKTKNLFTVTRLSTHLIPDHHDD